MKFKFGKRYKLRIKDPQSVSFDQTIITEYMWDLLHNQSKYHMFKIGFVFIEICDVWFDPTSPQVTVEELDY